MEVMRCLDAEGAANGPLLPRLKELEWTVSWSTDTASQLATFFSRTLKSLQVNVDINDEGETNSALLNLARRSDIELERLEASSVENYLEVGIMECLRCGWDLRSLSLSAPQVKIGSPVDIKLDSLPNLRSLFAVVSDEPEGDAKVIRWLTKLSSRFRYLTSLGLSFDRRPSHLPNIPLQHIAPLLRSSAILHIKLGFNPSIDLGEADVLEIGQAWPALQSLFIYNWGFNASRFPFTILSSFAMHMPPSLERLSLAFDPFTVTPLPVHHRRFPKLRVLALGYSEILHNDRPAVAAYLAKLCPPGLVLQRSPDFNAEVDDDEEDVAEIMALMKRYHEQAAEVEKAVQNGV